MSGCAQPDTRCHLLLALERWLMAHVRCQGTLTSPGEYSVRSTWPGRFAAVAAPQHSCAVSKCSTCCDVPPRLLMSILGSQCPSSALPHPRWCWQHAAGPQELQFYRALKVPWQNEMPPSADLTPHPAGQLSSPTHGWFWHLSHTKHEKNCLRGTNFALTNSSRMKLEAKRWLSLPVSLHPLPHTFYCWLSNFLSCSLLVVWDEMKDF